MKKFLPFILILIILTGILTPIEKTQAQTVILGTCQNEDGSFLINTSYKNCKDNYIDKDPGGGYTWTQGVTPPKNPLPSKEINLCPTGQTLGAGNKCVSNGSYVLLAPLPGEDGPMVSFNPKGENALGTYLNLMIRLFIGICAVLAVIMTVIGGIEYMTSDLISNKEHGKERITNAIFGLVLALGAYTLLFTINPNLLKTDLTSIGNIEVEVTLAEDNMQATATNPVCVEADMVVINLFGQSGVKVNKSVVATLRNIEQEWFAKGGNNYYKINTVFGYNCRAVRNKPGFWSAHSFGLALDINQASNPYGKTLVTDMEPSKFYELFEKAGWTWGGRWTSIKDAMHFSSNGE